MACSMAWAHLTHWLICAQVIASDGEATDGDIAAALRPLRDLPAWVVVRLCTDDDRVVHCVEINQCVGCTRQFFTKSFLGDDAADLARSSGEEPASPRHRAGVASMTWRTTR